VQPFVDSFALAPVPQQTVKMLVDRLEDFAHLRQARVACIFSERTLFLHGGQAAAIITTGPIVQGPCRHLVEWLVSCFVAEIHDDEVDFLILFDHPHWDGLDPERRERLVYHELCHVLQAETDEGAPKFSSVDGRPVLKLVPHDREFFDAEVERYGVEVVGIEGAAIAIAEGERRKRARGVSAA
jgi:hypothetical protein